MSPRASKDWFRKQTWSESDSKDFDAHLARARKAGRAQYLRIQAHHLAESDDPGLLRAAVRLLDRQLEECPDDVVERGPAHALRAACLWRLGEVGAAVEAFRAAIRIQATTNTAKTLPWLDFGWRVVTERRADYYREAEAAMDDGACDPKQRLAFPVQKFRFHAAKALIASAQGRHDEAAEHARRALEAAALQHSGFRYHANLGLVDEVEAGIRDQLQRLAGPSAP